MAVSKADNYLRRFQQVFEYIDKHLYEELNLERLSQQASFSKFHFQRQFSEYYGLSPARYIQLIRCAANPVLQSEEG